MINILGILLTPPISEIIWVKNVRAIVVCGFLTLFLPGKGGISPYMSVT